MSKRKNNTRNLLRKELEKVKEGMCEFLEQVENIARLLSESHEKDELISMRNQLARINTLINALKHQAQMRSIHELDVTLEPAAIRVGEVLALAQACVDAAEVHCIH